MRRITRIFILLLAAALVALVGRPLHEPEPPTPARAPAAPPTLAFTGDILLAGRAARMIAAEGPDAPFAGVADLLQAADLAVGNLECSLAAAGRPARKEFTFRAPPETADALRRAGYDVVGLANNHSADYGPQALLETLDAVRRRGLHPVGAGEDLDEARRVVLLARGSPPLRIALLAFSNMLPTDFYAGQRRPGTNPALLANIQEDIAAARRQADLVVAMFHWGDELSSTPSESQRYLAREAVQAGADLVVGHHPHVLQGFEQRGRALIAYSLGNFLFPSRGAASRTAVLRYQPQPDGSARAEVIPCTIEGFRPRLAVGDDRRQIIAQLQALSAPLGAELSDDGVILLPAPAASVDKAGRQP